MLVILMTRGSRFLLNETLIEKYGKYIHLTPENLEKVHKWFDNYGNYQIVFAYFIPGIRHITGYFSGITKISFIKFVVNAYFGALIWTTTFITFGKILGYKWETIHTNLPKYFVITGVMLIFALFLIYYFKNHKHM